MKNAKIFIALLLLVPSVTWANRIIVNSIYPEEAVQKCIEGWVMVEFSVLSNGTTINHKVIDSKPKGVFEKSALEAAKIISYENFPNAIGKRTDGVQTKYSYKLDKGSPQYAHCNKT